MLGAGTLFHFTSPVVCTHRHMSVVWAFCKFTGLWGLLTHPTFALPSAASPASHTSNQVLADAGDSMSDVLRDGYQFKHELRWHLVRDHPLVVAERVFGHTLGWWGLNAGLREEGSARSGLDLVALVADVLLGQGQVCYSLA